MNTFKAIKKIKIRYEWTSEQIDEFVKEEGFNVNLLDDKQRQKVADYLPYNLENDEDDALINNVNDSAKDFLTLLLGLADGKGHNCNCTYKDSILPRTVLSSGHDANCDMKSFK